jgi:putative peptidoglycan lipid II flippase
MLPAMFGVSVAQLNLLFDTFFASFLPTGSISWLYYSDRLMEFPLGVFGVALVTVALPHLSKEYSQKNYDNFNHSIDWSLQLIVLIALPAAIGLYLLAGPLLATLFGHGNFSDFDVYKTSLSLKAYAWGLFAFISVKLLASANYAMKDIKTPVKIAAFCMITNIILNGILMQYFDHVGLAMACTITGFLNAGLLLRVLMRRGIYQPDFGKWRGFIKKIVVANATWVFLACWFLPELTEWLQWGMLQRLWVLLLIVAAVIIVYFGALRLLGLNLRKHFIISV